MNKIIVLIVLSFFIVNGYFAYQYFFPKEKDPNQLDYQAYTKSRKEQIERILNEK